MNPTKADLVLDALATPEGPESARRVIDGCLAALRGHLGLDVAYVGRFRSGRRWFDFVDADPDLSSIAVGDSDPLDEPPAGRVAEGRLCAPIHARDGRLLGELACFGTQPETPAQDRDVKVVRTFADILAVHLESLEETEREVSRIRGLVGGVLEGRGLSIALQPIVELPSRQPCGYEALARFRPEVGWSPDRWFARAHEVGLGVPLELAAVDAALAVATPLPETCHLSVNLSPHAVRDPAVAELLQRPRRHGVIVELTEHARIEAYGEIDRGLARLREIGVQIAVDDAGSGYAGLEWILGLEPDVLKVDRNLVQGIGDHIGKQAMVEALVGFCDRVGARLVAEGVENEQELQTLEGLGVRYAQGYHLGRPQPADVVLAQQGPGGGDARSGR